MSRKWHFCSVTRIRILSIALFERGKGCTLPTEGSAQEISRFPGNNEPCIVGSLCPMGPLSDVFLYIFLLDCLHALSYARSMARPRSEDKRNALMAAATRVIVTQGLSAPTAMIAQEAAVSNGSLFTYFETKADLFNQLYLELKAGYAASCWPWRGFR